MKQATVYQGLFLIAFALYANERNQAHPVVIQKETKEAAEPAPVPIAPELAILYQKLKVAAVFTTPIDGVSLSQTPRAIKIRIQNDELYQAGEIAMEETWLPLLDQIGNTLFSTDDAKVDFIFEANTTSEKNSFAVSSERADWVLRYFERKYRFRLDQGKYRVMGLGKNTDQATGKTTPLLEIIIKPEGER